MTRPPAISAAVVTVVVAVVIHTVTVQATLLVFAQVSAVAAAVAGLVTGVARPAGCRARRRAPGLRSSGWPAPSRPWSSWPRGTAVLEGRFLVAWVVTAVIGTLIATGVSWGVGRVGTPAR